MRTQVAAIADRRSRSAAALILDRAWLSRFASVGLTFMLFVHGGQEWPYCAIGSEPEAQHPVPCQKLVISNDLALLRTSRNCHHQDHDHRLAN